VCSEVQEWIEEEIEQPVESFVSQWQEVCEEQECNWWCLCCNKWLCWMAWVVVRVITWVVVTVGKWVTRIACEMVNIPLDILGFIIVLILSIPVIGGIIRTILNWLTEIFWRAVGLLDFLGSLVGIRLRKKLYFGAVIPSINGVPIATDADMMVQVNATISIYDSLCNINAIFTGICHTDVPPPGGKLTVDCTVGGFFADWWILGSYFEFAASLCKFRDSFRRVFGLGAEILVYAVEEITPTTTTGCSYGPTHNYVTIEARAGQWSFTAAHEIGHACGLGHSSDTGNLMNGSSSPSSPTLTGFEISMIRWSRHCVYI
jgi:hypothetical protein